MKKLLIFFAFVFTLFFGAGQIVYSKDIIPVRPNIVSVRTVGLYQVCNDITIYKRTRRKFSYIIQGSLEQ